MQLIADVMDAAGTELVDAVVAKAHRRDGLPEYYLLTESVYTPGGLPVRFEVDIGVKGRGLSVWSVDAVLLSVSGFNVYHEVRIRLPTDEVVRIALYDR